MVADAAANDTNIYVNGVSCVSSSDCTAVGYTNNGTFDQTLVEHWDGTAWRPVTSPNASSNDNQLVAVSCSSSSDCTAVGSYSNGTIYQTLVEQWDGTAWTILTSPNVSTTVSVLLLGVTCTSASDCTAVGKYFPSAGSGDTQPVIEHWDGASWSISSSPTPPGPDYWLDGVTCVSASDCTAVGGYEDATLIEHWDGMAWSIVSSPTTAVIGPNEWLTSVSCASASDCIAVGFESTVHWDGTAWTLVSTLGTTTALEGVACTSAANCTAVGIEGGQSLVEQWNASTWAVVTSPTFGGPLDGISCISASDCTAVGSVYAYPSGVGVYQAPIEHWNGTAWTMANQLGAPGAPTGVTAKAQVGQTLVTFNPATLDGGAAITSYQVTATDSTKATNGGQTATGSTSPIGVTGLTAGDSYTFTITATNIFGTGSTSSASNPVTAESLPGVPTLDSAVAGNGEVLLTWSAPKSNGGSPITGYDIFVGTSTNGESSTPIQAPVSGTATLVTGLQNGKTYYFKVTAVTALGSSSRSNEVSATPTPVVFTVEPGLANDISQGADGSVWVIGTNAVHGGYGIYHWTGNGWAAIPGGAVTIAVAPDGTPFVINSAHRTFEWTGTSWVEGPGTLTDIALGADGSLSGIGTNPVHGGYGIYHWTGNGWAAVPGGALTISVAPLGIPWVVNSSHRIYAG